MRHLLVTSRIILSKWVIIYDRKRLFNCYTCVPVRQAGLHTHGYPVILVCDLDVVPFPGDCRFWVTSGGDALHYGRLACCHHHIAGRLTEVIPQNYERETTGRSVRNTFKQKTSAHSHQSDGALLPFNIIYMFIRSNCAFMQAFDFVLWFDL